MKTNTILEKTTTVKMLLLSVVFVFPAFITARGDDKPAPVAENEISATVNI